MQFIRKSALGLCVSLLFSVLLLFGVMFGLFKVFGSSEPIKNALKDSGVYQSVVGDTLKQVQKEQNAGGEQQLPLDRPEVQNIIKTAASPETLQTQVERALDAVYAWLQGKTKKLEFVVELGDVKANLANGVEQYVAQHVASLPVCGPGTTGNIEDPFNATCRPKGVDTSHVAAEAKNQITNGEFLKDTKLDASTLKGQDGRSLDQQLAAAPQTYKYVKWASYGLGLMAVLLAVGVIFLSVHWRAGLKKVAIIFVVIGAMSIFFSWLAGFGMQRIAELATEPLQKNGLKIAQILAGDVRSWWLLYGCILLVLGLGTLITLRLTRRKLVGQEANQEATGTSDAPGSTLESDQPLVPSPKSKPRAPKKLVQ